MRSVRVSALVLLAVILLTLPVLADFESKDQEIFNQGKVLMFDKKWEDARIVFQRLVQDHAASALVPQACYFIGRCYQLQGKETEALRAYEYFLQKYPNELILPTEARNAVVELSVALLEKGNSEYKDRVLAGLKDSRKEVRYFSAIRCSYLKDKSITSLAIPILTQIVDSEKERDLSDRARIALLRLDANALSRPQRGSEAKKNEEGSSVRMFHIRVAEDGAKDPTVELNLPLSLAQLALAALSTSQKDEIKKKGFDVDNVWESLNRLGPMNILTIRDGKSIIKIWIE